MAKKILHIAVCDKFIPPFIRVIKKEFNFEEHDFMLTSGIADIDLNTSDNIYLLKRKGFSCFKFYLLMLLKMHKADKVILHGLSSRLVQILFFSPWLLKKCYWVIWGGDLYTYQLGAKNWKWKAKEVFRRVIIKNIKNLVTYVKGDVELARKWYGAKGDYIECLMYMSNLYNEYKVPSYEGSTINILIGNSADPSNNHLEILDLLLPFIDENICIYAPISYGSSVHAKKVSIRGSELFDNKFIPLTELMPFDDYLKLLGSIDIAIFNHKRQQAMGSTITLLGLGKTVYIRSDTTQWEFFLEKDISVKDTLKFKNLKRGQENKNKNIAADNGYCNTGYDFI